MAGADCGDGGVQPVWLAVLVMPGGVRVPRARRVVFGKGETMATVTYWHKGRALSPAEFEALQAEKAARRPAEAVDRCLLVSGGGAFCMKRESASRWFGCCWRGGLAQTDGPRFARVICEQWSNHAGTRGMVRLAVSFDPDDECGAVVYRRKFRGLLPAELLPAWVSCPVGNLRQHGRDVAKWEV